MSSTVQSLYIQHQNPQYLASQRCHDMRAHKLAVHKMLEGAGAAILPLKLSRVQNAQGGPFKCNMLLYSSVFLIGNIDHENIFLQFKEHSHFSLVCLFVLGHHKAIVLR